MFNSSKTAKLKLIFEDMSYGDSFDEFKLVNDWLDKLIKKSNEEVDNMISFSDLDSFDRASFLVQFARTIEEHSLNIAQIEAKLRGILIKDTLSQCIPYLCDSLVYYSSYVDKIQNSKQFQSTFFILNDEIFLGLLGPLIGSAIASGHHIVAQCETKISTVIKFIVHLAEAKGLPISYFKVISDTEDFGQFLYQNNVNFIAALDNFSLKKYVDFPIPLHIKILKMETNLRSSMIIFSDCDLDSALETAIEAAWSYQSLLPWSVNYLLVQESILDSFIKKLKKRLPKLKVNESNNKSASDIAVLRDQINYKKTLIRAKKLGFEIHQVDPKSDEFQPTFIMGGNSIISEGNSAPILNVEGFRGPDEAVTLANNTRQGLAASVWTQNIDLAEQIAQKLMVSNVWINTHGKFSPLTSISLHKLSGVGHIGGYRGFWEQNVSISKPKPSKIKTRSLKKIDLSAILKTLTSKKSFWTNLSIMDRFKSLVAIKNITTNKIFGDFYKSLLHISNAVSFNEGDYTFKSIEEPLGVILIFIAENNQDCVGKIISASLLQGNSVIVVTLAIPTDDIVQGISFGKIPIEICDTDKFNEDFLLEISKNKEINAIALPNDIIESEFCLNFLDIKKLLIINDKWDDAFAQTSIIKNIWSTKRYTF